MIQIDITNFQQVWLGKEYPAVCCLVGSNLQEHTLALISVLLLSIQLLLLLHGSFWSQITTYFSLQDTAVAEQRSTDT